MSIRSLPKTPGLLLLFLAITRRSIPGEVWKVRSPGGDLSIEVELAEAAGTAPDGDCLSFRVFRGDREVMPRAPLGISLERLGQFRKGLHFAAKSTSAVDARHTMPVWKKNVCFDRANVLTLDFANETGAQT